MSRILQAATKQLREHLDSDPTRRTVEVVNYVDHYLWPNAMVAGHTWTGKSFFGGVREADVVRVFKDPAVRSEFESAFQTAAAEEFRRRGLEVTGARVVDMSSPIFGNEFVYELEVTPRDGKPFELGQ